MAEGMGVPGAQVSKPEEIAGAIADALNQEGPFMLDLVVEGLETR